MAPRQKHAPILFHHFFSWGGKGEFFTGVHRANLLSVKGNMQLVSFRKEKTFLENKLADALKWKELLVGILFLRGRLVSPPPVSKCGNLAGSKGNAKERRRSLRLQVRNGSAIPVASFAGV